MFKKILVALGLAEKPKAKKKVAKKAPAKKTTKKAPAKKPVKKAPKKAK